MPLSAVQVIFLLYVVVATFSFPTAAKNLLLKMIGIDPRRKHQSRLGVFPRVRARIMEDQQYYKLCDYCCVSAGSNRVLDLLYQQMFGKGQSHPFYITAGSNRVLDLLYQLLYYR